MKNKFELPMLVKQVLVLIGLLALLAMLAHLGALDEYPVVP